jgi:hypothetical protein
MDQDYKPSAGEHPITPPEELVQQWRATPEYTDLSEKIFLVTLTTKKLQDIATQAARWGADQQLAKDAKWLDRHALDAPHLKITPVGESLIEAMRPKPQPEEDDIYYAWELVDADGEWQAGGSANSLKDVQREGNRCLQTYAQDGPHKLIIHRHCVNTIEEVTNG